MALILDLRSEQRDDGKLLTIWDVTENWGVGGNDALTDITKVSVKVSYHPENNNLTYNTTNWTVFGTAEFEYVAGTIDEQSDLYFYIAPNDAGTYLQVEAKTTPIGTNPVNITDTAYTDELLNDGIWRVDYTIYKGSSVQIDTQYFIYYLNYSIKVDVYDQGRKLPDDYKLDELEYNNDVERFLTNFAMMKAAEYAAAAGQIEIVEDIHYTLEDILSDE